MNVVCSMFRYSEECLRQIITCSSLCDVSKLDEGLHVFTVCGSNAEIGIDLSETLKKIWIVCLLWVKQGKTELFREDMDRTGGELLISTRWRGWLCHYSRNLIR